MQPETGSTPATAAELAQHLAAATDEQRVVVPWGSGTHQHLIGPVPADALVLHTSRLARVREYTPADLTITVETGATLASVQALLAAERQWLPWDPPGAATATIGGLLAAGAAGPLRLGYGTPRDWLLGATVALSDGRLIKSGGKVVKNVAGYDLHKLQIGAFGTLGVICEVTFKIAPLPESQVSGVAVCTSLAEALTLAEQVRSAPLAPISLAVADAGAARLIGITDTAAAVAVRYAGATAAVERQFAAALAAGPFSRLDTEAASALWQALARFREPAHSAAGTLIVRGGVAPPRIAELAGILSTTETHSALLALPGIGVAYAQWHDTTDLAATRASLDAIGGYVVVDNPPGSRSTDRRGTPPPTLGGKGLPCHRWDAHMILNRGRYIV